MKLIDQLDVYIKIQNIQLLKLICYQEEWDYQEMLSIIKEIYISNLDDQKDKLDKENTDTDIVKQIKELIETRVRPAVAMDGGDIIYDGFKEGVVYLKMQGACSGCPSSTATLKMGIENMLKHYVPEVKEVRPVDA